MEQGKQLKEQNASASSMVKNGDAPRCFSHKFHLSNNTYVTIGFDLDFSISIAFLHDEKSNIFEISVDEWDSLRKNWDRLSEDDLKLSETLFAKMSDQHELTISSFTRSNNVTLNQEETKQFAFMRFLIESHLAILKNNASLFQLMTDTFVRTYRHIYQLAYDKAFETIDLFLEDKELDLAERNTVSYIIALKIFEAFIKTVKEQKI